MYIPKLYIIYIPLCILYNVAVGDVSGLLRLSDLKAIYKGSTFLSNSTSDIKKEYLQLGNPPVRRVNVAAKSVSNQTKSFGRGNDKVKCMTNSLTIERNRRWKWKPLPCNRILLDKSSPPLTNNTAPCVHLAALASTLTK